MKNQKLYQICESWFQLVNFVVDYVVPVSEAKLLLNMERHLFCLDCDLRYHSVAISD